MAGVGAVIFIIVSLTAIPASAWDVSIFPAARKILPGTTMTQSGLKSVHLKSARNEWEGFQIAIRSDDGAAGVNVSVTELSGPGGSTIPAENVLLYREHFLDIKSASPISVTLHERVPGLYPDPLIPFNDPFDAGKKPVGAPFDLDPGETAVVFAEVPVPQGTPPGDYTGSAMLTATGRAPINIAITLTVWEFDLPRTIGTSYFFDDDLMKKFHGGPAEKPPAQYRVYSDRYYEELHRHRLDPTTIYSPVTFKFGGDGNLLPVDWTQYDREVAPWMDGSRFSDGVGMVRFNVKQFQPGTGTGSMTEDQYSQAAAAVAQHLKDKGWLARAYMMTVDEPWRSAATMDRVKRDVALLGMKTDLWKGRVLVTGPYDDILAGSIGTWCPMTPQYENWFVGENKPGRAKYAERFALGEKLWFYVCNADRPPYAGYDIDSAIGFEPRMVKWGAWFEKATGFLYWGVNHWTDDDPWNVFKDTATFGEKSARNGDGMLIYPGDHDGTAGGKGSPSWLSLSGPIVSFRMKQIRDGLEDWELFNYASGLGGEDYVRKQVGRAYDRFGTIYVEDCGNSPPMYCPSSQPWTLDEDLLFDVREKVAAKTLFLLFPDRYPDPEKQVFDGGIDSGVQPSDGGKHEPAGGCGCTTVGIE
jgi:hypothetical protein